MRALGRLFKWLAARFLFALDRLFGRVGSTAAGVGRGAREFAGWWTVRRVGIAFLLLALLTGAVGYITQHPGRFDPRLLFEEYYANLSSEMVGIALTVLIIDALYQRRQAQDRRARLAREMRNRDNAVAVLAVDELRDAGWLMDGSLAGVNLWGANLREADLSHAALPGAYLGRADMRDATLVETNLRDGDLSRADLQGAELSKADLRRADLSRSALQDISAEWVNFQQADISWSDLTNASLAWANLERADLTMSVLSGATMRNANLYGARVHPDAQLATVRRLRGAVMPDGRPYDGRYRLTGDQEDAVERGIDPADEAAMARWYQVSLEVYQAGQLHQTVRDAYTTRDWYERQLAAARGGAGDAPPG